MKVPARYDPRYATLLGVQRCGNRRKNDLGMAGIDVFV
jgi:hypothetical protein